MMKKISIINRIVESGVVAVVRASSVEEAINIASSCVDGKIKAIEITFTVDGAIEVIKALKNKFKNADVLIGAGTVLDSETARLAIINGADFIVGPNFNLAEAKLCNRYQIPYMPGCVTINEMIEAMESGCDIIKVFPGSLVTPSYIKAIKGPLPQINLMPTGGVNIDNVGEWIKNGCVCVGIGGELTSPSKNKDFAEVTKRALEFVQKVKESR